MTNTPEIRGTFTHLDMTAPKASPLHPLAKAQATMVGELARLVAPKLHVNPEPDEFENVADYLLRVTALFDMWLQEVGAEVKSNALCHIDAKAFSEQFYGVICGNATHELDCAAEAAREAQDEGADADAAWDARDSW